MGHNFDALIKERVDPGELTCFVDIVVTFPLLLLSSGFNELPLPLLLLLLPMGLVISTGLILFLPFFFDTFCILRTGLLVDLNDCKTMPSVELDCTFPFSLRMYAVASSYVIVGWSGFKLAEFPLPKPNGLL